MKVRNQFIIPVAAVIFCGLTAIGVITYSSARTGLTKAVGNTMEQVLDATMRTFQLYLRNAEKDLNLAESALTGTDPERPAEMRRILEEYWKVLGYGELLGVGDSQGRMITLDKKEGAYINVADREYFQKAIKGETAFSRVLISKYSGDPVFVLAVPYIPKEEIRGVLLISIPLTTFTLPYLEPVTVGQGGRAFMTDGRGLTIYHSDPKHIMQTDISQFPWGRRMLDEGNGSFGYTFNGEKKQLAFRTEPVTGWRIAINAVEKDIYSSVLQLRRRTILVSGAILLFSLLIIILLAGAIVRNLRKGIDISSEVTRGKLNIEFDPRFTGRKDEMGELARSFETMTASLQAKSKILEEISQGFLNVDTAPSSDDDVLGLSLASMTDNLNQLIAGIGETARQVNQGADQIAITSQSLSAGATEQAASIEEISASLNELKGESRKNDESISRVVQLSRESCRVSQTGEERIGTLQEAMERLKTSSSSIEKIVKVIDDIAFQTNILSLNASVEAARSGKYGKGFAVVAEEVRNLALRTGESVKETENVVAESSREIGNVFSIVNDTVEVIKEINRKIEKVEEILIALAEANRRQSAAILQINEGMEQIETVTQNNTAAAEESSAASEELAVQAGELKRNIGLFTLRGEPVQKEGMPRKGHPQIQKEVID